MDRILTEICSGNRPVFCIFHTELRKANEILKDALGFFAKDRKQ